MVVGAGKGYYEWVDRCLKWNNINPDYMHTKRVGRVRITVTVRSATRRVFMNASCSRCLRRAMLQLDNHYCAVHRRRYGTTSLAVAAREGHLRVCALLLKYGAHVDIRCLVRRARRTQSAWRCVTCRALLCLILRAWIDVLRLQFC